MYPSEKASAGPDEHSRATVEAWLRRLRVASVVAPIAFLAALPLLWPSNWHMVAGLVGAVAVVVFSRLVFTVVQRGHDQMVALQERAVHAERHSAVLRERERIAREMHDSLAQVLSVAHLRLRTVEAHPGLPDATRQEVSDLADLCQESCREVREQILGLREGSREDRDFVEGLQHFLDVWSRTSGVPATIVTHPDPAVIALSPEQEVQLSRIAQEALANVRKHARARQATVVLDGDEQGIRLEIMDDGLGFDTDLPSQQGSYGLHTMRERIEEIGGLLEVHSTPGSGTRVVARLPRTAAAQEPATDEADRPGRPRALPLAAPFRPNAAPRTPHAMESQG